MQVQLNLFDDAFPCDSAARRARSGTFVDNLTLPVHRWFRFSAGFAADWVQRLLTDWHIDSNGTVLDPFAGSGTVSVACDLRGTASIAVDANPVISRICRAKLHWATSVDAFARLGREICRVFQTTPLHKPEYPDLVERSFDCASLRQLHGLKEAWRVSADGSPASELVWLAITAILRPCSKAGTAQWQYILPSFCCGKGFWHGNVERGERLTLRASLAETAKACQSNISY